MPLKQEGHRERMRRRFLSGSIDTFEPREVLELMLFYAIPRIDTRELSIRLLERFGTFDKVFEASYEELQQVEGIGPNAASLIVLFRSVFGYYERSKADAGFSVNGAKEAEKYCKALFAGESNEICYLLCFDSKLKLTNTVRISEGTVNSTSVSTRKVVESAVANKAVMAILTHNHPDGTLSPSAADLVKTKQLMQALSLVGVELCDHVIVAGGKALSMAAGGVIFRYKEELGLL